VRRPSPAGEAEREGFEPSIQVTPGYPLSRRALSASQPPLRAEDYRTGSPGVSTPRRRGLTRRGGRAVECNGLENRQGFAPLVGSNPTPSAASPAKRRVSCDRGLVHPGDSGGSVTRQCSPGGQPPRGRWPASDQACKADKPAADETGVDHRAAHRGRCRRRPRSGPCWVRPAPPLTTPRWMRPRRRSIRRSGVVSREVSGDELGHLRISTALATEQAMLPK